MVDSGTKPVLLKRINTQKMPMRHAGDNVANEEKKRAVADDAESRATQYSRAQRHQEQKERQRELMQERRKEIDRLARARRQNLRANEDLQLDRE